MHLKSPLIHHLVAAAIFGGSLGTAAGRVDAATPALTQSQAGYYRVKIGALEVIALSDGTVQMDAKLLQASDPAAIDSALKVAYVASPIDASVNAYLIKLSGRLVLIDAGAGTLFGPSLFKLPQSLRSAGYAPEQITDILVTHVHTDHTGGLTDGARRVYPNATIHLDQRELDFWMTPENETRASPDKKAFFQQARASLSPYVAARRIRAFDGAAEVVPGIRSVPAPGHTPGHTFYRLANGGEAIVFWGDLLHVAEVQLQDPSVTIAYDVDPGAAAAQRKRAFAEAADRGDLVAPAHMSFPGVGHLRRDGLGARWIPLRYVDAATVPAR